MKQLSRIAFALMLAAAFSLPPATASELAPHRAEYKVKISVVSGQLNTELKATDTGYIATHVIKPTGLSRMITHGTMSVSSTFKADADGVKPVTYHAIDTIGDDPETHISFDWNTNEASGTVGDEDVLLHLDGIAHDSVSIQYALMDDLINGEPDNTYVLFDVDKMRVAEVRNVGTKQVKTKAGQFEAVGIQHQKQGSSRVTTLWCARELGYLPVIIEQHR
ncbi:MAG TPA: DUF3108 domain-containing protein, partial [Woeseiaceae bacterium]|nr:DUF3108 domain-containing protein [Woeseiaceae bacterium]